MSPKPSLANVGAQSTPRLTSWACGGALAGALLALVLFAPAQWLVAAVHHVSERRLLLIEPSGTVWKGSARMLLTGGADTLEKAVLPGRVQWALARHLTGLRLQLLAPCCTPAALELHVTAGAGGLRLDVADGQSQWPALLLAGLGTPWNTLGVTGELNVQSQSLGISWASGTWQMTGRAVLILRTTGSHLTTLRPLGSYRVQVEGGLVPSVTLDTLEGSLRLAGSGQWLGSRLRFSGEASAAPDREEALANLLNVIGRRNGARTIITLG